MYREDRPRASTTVVGGDGRHAYPTSTEPHIAHHRSRQIQGTLMPRVVWYCRGVRSGPMSARYGWSGCPRATSPVRDSGEWR
jgi:hypothetical protein